MFSFCAAKSKGDCTQNATYEVTLPSKKRINVCYYHEKVFYRRLRPQHNNYIGKETYYGDLDRKQR